MKAKLMDTIELVLNVCGNEDLWAIVSAIVHYCRLATEAPVSREIHITIEGGAYLALQDQHSLWRQMLPPGTVAQVLIGGRDIYADRAGSDKASTS
jgi:hypothetical protein